MRRAALTAGGRSAAAAALLLASSGSMAHPRAGSGPVHLRTSEAFAPCLAPALQAFSRESGLSVVVDVGDLDPPRGADVVIGDDSEMTRLLEGGLADLGTSFDLGSLPWVMVVPAGSPVASLSVLAPERVSVMGGRASRAARESLHGMPAERVRVSRDADELRQARYALVPRSLAGPGEQRPSGVRPLMAVTAVIADAPHASGARALLAFLRSERARRLLASCLDAPGRGTAPARVSSASGAAASYAQSVVDWWLPECSLTHNGYNDPGQVLGRPDAAFLGTKDQYTGIMSLGQGGYVTVDMGDTAVDGRGPDVRVYQVTGAEPVTLYAAASAQGPFTVVALREDCGTRVSGFGNFERSCDFDLHDAGVAEARYFKIEDGEIYPCLAGGTITEGADIDAIEILNKRP
ncbi:MAG TPA: hypothetical protein VGN09_10310 [Vicinamibacteria bacterium]